jgi:hypothetical protein
MWHPPTKAELAMDRADQASFYAQAAAETASTDDCERPIGTEPANVVGGTKRNAGRSRGREAPTLPGTPWPQFGNPSAVLDKRTS